jgi:hypothetical protein
LLVTRGRYLHDDGSVSAALETVGFSVRHGGFPKGFWTSVWGGCYGWANVRFVRGRDFTSIGFPSETGGAKLAELYKTGPPTLGQLTLQKSSTFSVPADVRLPLFMAVETRTDEPDWARPSHTGIAAKHLTPQRAPSATTHT